VGSRAASVAHFCETGSCALTPASSTATSPLLLNRSPVDDGSSQQLLHPPAIVWRVASLFLRHLNVLKSPHLAPSRKRDDGR
jgi:hypothetical protein